MDERVAIARWTVPDTSRREDDYARSVRAALLEPVDIYPTAETPSLLQCRGLLLRGGVDIDPSIYGRRRHDRTENIDRERDEFELALLKMALDRDLPVLAICRGHQLLNVAFDGTLLQDIGGGEHAALTESPGNPSRSHGVRIRPGTRLGSLFGDGEIWVNSRHHQAVTPVTLGAGLKTVATTDDDLIEAVESENHTWVVGVQWHPERSEPEIPGFEATAAALFAAFAKAVRSA